MPTLLLLLLVATVAVGSPIGVNYGNSQAVNPLPVAEAFSKLHNAGVHKIKLYDHDVTKLAAILKEYGNDAQVVVAIPNSELSSASSNTNWVSSLVGTLAPYKAIISHVAVGNEADTSSTYFSQLPQAITNVASALKTGGFSAKAITPLSFSVIGASDPPSSGAFRSDLNMSPLLTALSNAGSPFAITIYPYFAYIAQTTINFDYALGRSTSVVVTDPTTGLGYKTLFDAQFDVVYFALGRVGHSAMEIVVGEVGWPTGGETYATVANALAHNSLLAAHATKGTPAVPNPYLLFVFEAFDEQNKDGAANENYWGVYTEGGSAKYSMNWNSTDL